MQENVDNYSDEKRSTVTARLAAFERYHVLILVAATVIADHYGLLHVDRAIQLWDGTDLGSIARNFYLNGMHFLYPQIDWGGNGPGYVEMQFPLTPYLTALLYKLFGFHEQLAIVVPFFSGLGTVLAVYYFARDVYDSSVGVLAGLFVALSPFWAWQCTIFANDPFMIFCGTIGLYYLHRWSHDEKWGTYFLSAAFIALAVLLKLTAIYLGLVILVVWVLKYKSAVIKEPRFWLYGVLTLLPAILWYYHSYNLYVRYGNTFGILAGGENKFATVDLLLSSKFYSVVFGAIFRFVLTPVVSLFLLFGMVRWERSGESNVFRVWVFVVLIYQLIAGYGSFLGQQYLIPILPPAAVVAASGLVGVTRRFRSTVLRSPRWILAAAFVLLGANYFWGLRIVQYMKGDDLQFRLVGQEVASVTPPGSLIIVATTQQSEQRVQNPRQLACHPQVFYYSNRKGWYRTMRWLDESFVEARRAEGASYLVIPLEVNQFITNHPMYKYLSTHYGTVVHNDHSLIYDLRVHK